jgi:NADH:ubiquinone oxidoreductase subunit 5 (subunit L)/multisubunit Na+/H+ antiporter MnhA subunit
MEISIGDFMMVLVGYGLVIGAITKSAQLGFTFLVGRSMEGPTQFQFYYQQQWLQLVFI